MELKQKRILVVDDDEDMTILIRMSLESHFEVVTHNKWDEAVFDIERSDPFDLVITDFRMPPKGRVGTAVNRQGLAVIEAVRQKSSHSSNKTKIILMSSDVTDQDLEEAAPDGYLVKVFGIKQMIDMVNHLIPDIEQKQFDVKKSALYHGALT